MTLLDDIAYSAPDTPFQLPPELVELKELVRSIVDKECIPLEPEYLIPSRDGASTDDGQPNWKRQPLQQYGNLAKEKWERLERISRDSGIYDIHLPVELGGSGFGILGRFVVDEETNRSVVRLPTASVPGILLDSSGAQRADYLLPTVRGEKQYAFAQTEPGAGSDPGNSMSTRAVADGNDWVINGTKTFITGAGTADYFLLLAVTDESRRQHGGITMFIVDADSPGLTKSPIEMWFPDETRQFTLHLDDVRVPGVNVVGEVGGGFRLGQRWLAVHDRLTRGSLACGILSRCLDMAVAWTQDRKTFGVPLKDRQAIQWMMVDVFTDLKCIRAISYECAVRADAGEDVRAYAALAKLIGARDWGHRSIDNIMQIFGGLGESLELPITHWYRMLRHGRIGGGTDEIQRILIARQIYKQGSSLWQA